MDNRPSVWAIGLGLGLCAVAGLLLGAIAQGLEFELSWLATGAAVIILGWFGLPFIVWLLMAGWAAFWAVREERDAWANRHGVTEAEPAVAPALPITEQLSRLERQRLQEVAHWQLYYRRLWAAATAYGWDIRTLTDKRRPTCVTSQGGWNLATDQLVIAGYLRKDTAGTVPLVTDADWQAGRLWERTPAPSGEPPDIAPPPYTRAIERNVKLIIDQPAEKA